MPAYRVPTETDDDGATQPAHIDDVEADSESVRYHYEGDTVVVSSDNALMTYEDRLDDDDADVQKLDEDEAADYPSPGDDEDEDEQAENDENGE